MSIIMPKGVTLWPVSKLVPFLRNPRTHSEDQVKTLARMMQRFGWTDPIIVDELEGILAGHLRYATALYLGIPEVPVIEVTHLTAEEKRAFLVGHNQIALRSSWNTDVLVDDLRTLRDADIPLDIAGFSDAELKALESSLDAGEESHFHPNLAPESSTAGVDSGDMERAQRDLDNKVKRNEYLNKVVCPHCGDEFYLSRQEAAE